MKGQGNLRSKAHTLVIGIVVILATPVLSVRSVYGRVMIQPMLMEFMPRSGEVVTREIEIQNTTAEGIETVDLKIVELSQDENGSWTTVEPNAIVDASKRASSCREWLKLSDNPVTVKPLSIVRLKMTMKVPLNARGFHGAAIIIQTRPPPAARGVLLVFQFVVPVLVSMADRPLRHNVELTDVGLEFQPAIERNSAKTLVTMGVINKGGTASRLRPLARIRYFVAGHWQVVTVKEFQEAAILPGVELKLKSDIGRSLPSGKYQISGALYVDERRVKPIEKEIAFAGDPNVKHVASDAEVFLTPRDVTIEGIPGSTRMGKMEISNFSDDAVRIKMSLSQPPVLVEAASVGLKGDDLNCSGWLKIEPEEFTLVGGGRQNIRFIVNMPNPGGSHPWYYSQLTLQSTYADGQNAGKKTAFICVGNKNIKTKPSPRGMRLNVAALEGSKYLIVGRFGNYGDVHFAPKCRASIVTPQGGGVRQTVLSGLPDLMIPFEVRDFAGSLDFNDVPVGTYRLTAILEYESNQTIDYSVPIQISGQRGQKSVQIIKTDEFEKAVGVKWQ